jgi:hypothetical protein
MHKCITSRTRYPRVAAGAEYETRDIKNEERNKLQGAETPPPPYAPDRRGLALGLEGARLWGSEGALPPSYQVAVVHIDKVRIRVILHLTWRATINSLKYGKTCKKI